VLVWSFRGLSFAARNACVAAASRTLVELAARSEFDARRSIAAIGSTNPALPLARCTGCAGFPRRADWAAVKPPSCSSLRAWPFLQSVAQQNPVRGPQPPDASHGLLFPSARAGFGDPLFAGVPSPLRSAFRVWSPSSRLSPVESGPALFHAGSARGIHPSEPSPSARWPVRFRPADPTCRFSRR